MIILMQTPHAWRGIRQRCHHLAVRFARRGHTVRWVEPRYLAWLVGRAEDFLRARPEEPEPRLEVRPVTLVNGERLAPIRARNKRRLAQALNSSSPSGDGPRVLWLYSPHEGHLADSVAHDLLIYDIMDEYQGFPWSPRRIAQEEAELLARADWVFAGTGALYDAKRGQAGGRIECILSGIEPEHFTRNRSAGLEDPEHCALRGRYPKLAGYAGMIDLRVDQELLVAAARRFPHWGFILLGPVATDTSLLRDSPNIHLLGPKPYEDLPAYYGSWDAGLLPFVESHLTRHINPTKMLEYAAAGLPIVARALPDVVRFYADGAWLYRTPEEFCAHLDQIEEADPAALSPPLAAARAWLRERTWDALADRMLDRVASLLSK